MGFKLAKAVVGGSGNDEGRKLPGVGVIETRLGASVFVLARLNQAVLGFGPRPQVQTPKGPGRPGRDINLPPAPIRTEPGAELRRKVL